MFFVLLLIVCKMFQFCLLPVASTSSTYLFQVLMSLLLATDLSSKSCITASEWKLESGYPLGVTKTCL